MSDSLKKLRIFAASPSDVVSERAKLETVVDSLKPMADYLGLTLEVIDWRAVVPDAGRPQQIIFDQLKPTSWDIFIGILWHRFGTPPGATDKTGKEYLSGTEEEFKTAYDLWKKYGKPRMVLYRCTRALPFDVDPDQLKNVRVFFKLIEDVKGDYPTLYQAFDTTESFEKLLLGNLQKLLIEYGEHEKTPITPEVAQVLAPRIPNNLPRRQAFFGRAKEMETVMRALSPADRTWGVLVDGIGGIGKSAIAVEAAYRCKQLEVFDAFIFASAKRYLLEPSGIKEEVPVVTTLDEFVDEAARVLGRPEIPKMSGEGKRRSLLNALREMRALLVFDNLETLSKEDQETLATWLRFLPQGCKAIITSRRRGGEGGVWLRVEKLDWDAARGIIENQMSLDISLANKLNHIGEARWQELYDETNGSPLALVHTLGLMRVRAALTFNGALEMLRGNREDDLQKFIFEEAYKELTENDKIALGALSFFIPSATFDAWTRVANLSRNVLETTIDRLNALSLVDILPSEDRYSLHPLTRTFVRNELLTNTGFAYEAEARFVEYWDEFCWQFTDWERDGYEVFNKLEEEWENLKIASNLSWNISTLQKGERKIGISSATVKFFARNLRKFLLYSGRWDERNELNIRAYQIACSSNDWKAAGAAAYDVAWVQFNRGNIKDTMLWTDRCEIAWTRAGSNRDRAIVTRMRGKIEQELENYDKAEKIFQEALVICRKLGKNEEIAIGLNSLGELAFVQKQYDVAERYYKQALKHDLKSDSKEGQTIRYVNLGELFFRTEKLEEAGQWFEKALNLANEIGRIYSIAQARYGLARIYATDGRIDLALPLVKDALKIYERLQHRELDDVKEFFEKLTKVA